MSKIDFEKEINALVECSCIDAYKLRHLRAPDCAACNYKPDLIDLVKSLAARVEEATIKRFFPYSNDALERLYSNHIPDAKEKVPTTNTNEIGSKLIDGKCPHWADGGDLCQICAEELVASKELKCCAFYGTQPTFVNPDKATCFCRVHFWGATLVKHWNDAWAHKRIAELENEVESQKHCYRLLEEHRAALQARNAELEGLRRDDRYQINDLEKRNDWFEAEVKEITRQNYALKAELKTAEDALAAERNKSEPMKGILDRITGKKERP